MLRKVILQIASTQCFVPWLCIFLCLYSTITIIDHDIGEGIRTIGGSGHPALLEGSAYPIFAFNSNMGRKAFVNLNDEFLLVAQHEHLDISTEFSELYLQPGEIYVIPRGIYFKIGILERKSTSALDEARGYLIEIWGSSWELPKLGPLEGHPLANSRDFLYPTAYVHLKSSGQWRIVTKKGEKYFNMRQDQSLFDIVAWHGDYPPYKCDLTKFVAQNTASKDHVDPSINTALIAKLNNPNASLRDFLVFGPRWDVAENIELQPMKLSLDHLTVMLESCRSFYFTKWAIHDSEVLVVEDIDTAD